MTNRIFIIVTVILFISSITLIAVEKAPEKANILAKNALVAFRINQIIVNAVKTENAKNKNLTDVKALDEKWKSTPGIVDYMKALITSDCGKHLNKIMKDHPYIVEIFVMDNLGANVAMTDKTSDYWQGDEDKFIKSFNNGNGAVHISDVEFDESTQIYVVQISVPVKDNNKTIGAITFSIDVEKIE